MSSPLRLRYRWWRKAVRQLRAQPLRCLPYTVRYGILPESLAVYKSEEDYKIEVYLSDYARRVRTPGINGEAGQLMNNKLAFHFAMQPSRSLLPRLFGLFRQGRIIAVPDGEVQRPPLEKLRELFNDGGSLVLKPVLGDRGAGVHGVDLRDGVVPRDGQPKRSASEPDLEAALSPCGRAWSPSSCRRCHAPEGSTRTLRTRCGSSPCGTAPMALRSVPRPTALAPRRHTPWTTAPTAVSPRSSTWRRAAWDAPPRSVAGVPFAGATSTRIRTWPPHVSSCPGGLSCEKGSSKSLAAVRSGPTSAVTSRRRRTLFTIIPDNSFRGLTIIQFDRPLLLDERARDLYAPYDAV